MKKIVAILVGGTCSLLSINAQVPSVNEVNQTSLQASITKNIVIDTTPIYVFDIKENTSISLYEEMRLNNKFLNVEEWVLKSMTVEFTVKKTPILTRKDYEKKRLLVITSDFESNFKIGHKSAMELDLMILQFYLMNNQFLLDSTGYNKKYLEFRSKYAKFIQDQYNGSDLNRLFSFYVEVPEKLRDFAYVESILKDKLYLSKSPSFDGVAKYLLCYITIYEMGYQKDISKAKLFEPMLKKLKKIHEDDQTNDQQKKFIKKIEDYLQS